MNVYTIRDSVAEFYLPPFTASNDGMAERMFIGSLGDSFNYREGFSLFRIGEFDDATGEIAVCSPDLVLSGASVSYALDPRPRPLSSPSQNEGNSQ